MSYAINFDFYRSENGSFGHCVFELNISLIAKSNWGQDLILKSYYAPVICNQCPPPPPPHLHVCGRVGDSRVKVQGNYFSSVLSVQRK